MAAPEGRERKSQSASLNQEAAARPRARGCPQGLPRPVAEFGAQKVNPPPGLGTEHGRSTTRLGETPLQSPGREGAAERSGGHRVVVAAASSPGREGVVVPPLSASLAQGFLPSAPSSGSLPVVLQQGQSMEAAVVATRLLPPKQLEPIRVQDQADQKRQKEKSILCPSTIQSRNITTAQPTEKNSKMLEFNVVNPPIIQLLPLTGTESQQFFICNSSEPTVHLWLQNPFPSLGQAPVTQGSTQGQKKPDATAAADSVNIPVVSACSENPLISHEGGKVQKPLKVKTRSGRISQPPKYKIKDYKFIKIEDLADCHQSDSDDYSELSLEDDGGVKEKAMCSLFDPFMYNLKPKLFKCQTCEKSYIGKGGLARHYRLNPDHGQQEPSDLSSTEKPHRMALLEHSRKTNGNSDTSVEDSKFAHHQLSTGPGRRRRTGRCSQSKKTERSRYSGRFNRPGRFCSKSLNNMTAEHHSTFRRKARLKELIEQSPVEDFMELAVPRLTTLVTVFEFLLKKVEKKCPPKALFPDVYREFEELHGMIKKMCQDYFSNPELNEPMEIKNPKVAESLEIADSCLKIQGIHTNLSPACMKTTCDQVFTEISGWKRASENPSEMLPVAKKTTLGNLMKNIGDAKHRGMKERSPPYEEASSAMYICPRSASPEEEHGLLERETTPDWIDQDLYDQLTQGKPEPLQHSSKARFDCSDCLNLME